MTLTITEDRAPRARRDRALWGLQLLLAAVFLTAGGQKLAGTEAMVEMFERIGAGQWLRVFTGVMEVGSGLLLLIPRTAARGAVMLAAIMLGAVPAQLLAIGGSPIPALVLLGLAVVVAWGRAAP